MPEEMKLMLIIGGVAVVVALMIFLLMRWIRKTFYDYNEYTGRVELKSKIRAESEKHHQIYLKNQRKKAEGQGKEEKRPERPNRYEPDIAGGEDWVFVRVINKSMTPATNNARAYYYINFYDVIYGDQYVMSVDRDTYESSPIGEKGNMYFKYTKKKGHTFCHFEPAPDLFEEDKQTGK